MNGEKFNMLGCMNMVTSEATACVPHPKNSHELYRPVYALGATTTRPTEWAACRDSEMQREGG